MPLEFPIFETANQHIKQTPTKKNTKSAYSSATENETASSCSYRSHLTFFASITTLPPRMIPCIKMFHLFHLFYLFLVLQSLFCRGSSLFVFFNRVTCIVSKFSRQCDMKTEINFAENKQKAAPNKHKSKQSNQSSTVEGFESKNHVLSSALSWVCQISEALYKVYT